MSSNNDIFSQPLRGLKGLRHNWRRDLFAASMVFMFSLPFCLSVAFAARLPLTSGVISAAMAGILITFISGSPLAIKAPSISLIPLLVFSVQMLGSGYSITGYQFTFALIVGAGVVQVLFGVLRLGEILSIVPEAIIYGVLATIGLTIFVQQFYIFIGLELSHHNTIQLLLDLPFLISDIRLEILFIGVLSIGLMLLFSSFRSRYVVFMPAPVLVILLGIFMANQLDVRERLGSEYLLSLSGEWSEVFIFPRFEKIFTYESLYLIFVFALFTSLETLLNIKNIDSTDFYRRRSKLNRELIALGTANILGGLVGGMPLVASMSHSSSNVNSGARTMWAGFFHGILLISGGFLLFQFISYVPKVSLAVILIYFAYTLNSPSLIKGILNIGREQLAVFLITLIASLLGGILLGVVIGFISYLAIFVWLGSELKSLFSATVKVVNYSDDRHKVSVRSEALASNYLSIKREIEKIPQGSQIYLDFSKSKVVDYSFLELVYHHPYNYNTEEGSIELQGLEDHKMLSEHPLSTRIFEKKKRRRFGEDLTMYNDRQLDVLAVASVNNSKLRPNLTYDGSKLQGFGFSLGYDIKYRENKFTKSYKSPLLGRKAKLEFSDIFLSKGVRMSEQSHHMSVLLIQDIDLYVPAFRLSHENIFDKMLQSLGYNDIDFDDFPNFSEHYLLKGINENEIRDFFNQELLEFLEHYKDFEIESSNNRVLIYKDHQLMNRTEMEDCVEFAEKLLNVFYQERQINLNEDEDETALIDGRF